MLARFPLPQPVLWQPPHEDDGRRVTWVELFFDLVFVAVVAQVGAPLADHYSPAAVGRYAFLLFVTWWAWHGYAVYATRFHGSDAFQRATALLQMVAVIFMAANGEGDLASESSAGFAAAYALMRLILVGEYLRASTLPPARRLALEHAAGYGLAALLWLVSALVPAPARFALWGLALAIDVGTAVLTARHATVLPPHAAHLPERFGLFTLILLGESMVAIVAGIQAQADWSIAAAVPAFAGIGLVFAIWWAYFEGAAGPAERPVGTRTQQRWFEVWSYAHMPLYLGVGVIGVGIEHIVASGGIGHLHLEEGLLLCGGTAAVVLALTLVAISSDDLPAAARRRVAGGGLLVAAAAFAVAPVLGAIGPGAAVASLAGLAAAQAVLLARTCRRGAAHETTPIDAFSESTGRRSEARAHAPVT
jgi:low temperature requirement protein LtrA